MSVRVSIDTRVTTEVRMPKKVCLRSKYKFNDCIVIFTVNEDLVADDDELGCGTLAAGVGSVLAPSDLMNSLLAYNVGDSVLVSFEYTGGLWMDNVTFG